MEHRTGYKRSDAGHGGNIGKPGLPQPTAEAGPPGRNTVKCCYTEHIYRACRKLLVARLKRKPNPHRIVDRTRPAGHIPEDFRYLTRQHAIDEALKEHRTNRHRIYDAAARSGLTPLGYETPRVGQTAESTDGWQLTGTPQGHPYLAINWKNTHDFNGQWYARVTVIVPIIDTHSQISTRTNRIMYTAYTNVDTGTISVPNRFVYDAHQTMPGIPVYTTVITSEEQFRQVLAEQDAILRTDPEQYMVYAALLSLQPESTVI